jgi:asparagine synthase (glutamine-hydrolysing)
VEKYILREAFRDLLPEAIYKRRKLRFAAGTGTDDRMDAVAAEAPEGGELTDANRRTPEGYTLSSPKELWYYNIFKKNFPAPCFEQLVGRWDPGK